MLPDRGPTIDAKNYISCREQASSSSSERCAGPAAMTS
jgi:hypothetical protein